MTRLMTYDAVLFQVVIQPVTHKNVLFPAVTQIMKYDYVLFQAGDSANDP